MRNIAIRASAGAGKTYELAVQFLARLVIGVPVHEILATTFTRKAAGEILARILAKTVAAATSDEALNTLNDDLRRALEDLGEPSVHLTQDDCTNLLARMCRDLHRFHVSTIDSLFVRMLSAFGLEAGLAARPRMTDDRSSAAVQARMRSLQVVLAKMDRAEALDILTSLVDNRSIRRVALKLNDLVSELEYLYRVSPATAWLPSALSHGACHRPLEDLATDLEAAAGRCSDRRLASALLKTVTNVRQRKWQDALARGPVASLLHGTEAYYGQPLPQEVRTLLRELRDSVAGEVGALVRSRLDGMSKLLAAFSPAYQQYLRDRDLLLFSELPLLIGEIIDPLGSKYVGFRTDLFARHILLDEFQDTNIEQWGVLRTLFRGALQQNKADDPGSFFCVGDAKQAIYGWRGGCAAIFDRLDQDIPNLTWQYRSTSYRSAQVILDCVDAVFTNLDRCKTHPIPAPILDRWRQHYRSHKAQRQLSGFVQVTISPARENPDPSTEPSEQSGNGDAEDPAAHAYVEWAAAKIAEIAAAHPSKTIGVLCRTNKMTGAVALALQGRLTASQEGPGALADDPAVELILSAMHLADHPGSRAEAFHVFNSPLRGLLGMDSEKASACNAVSLALRRRLSQRGYGETVAALAEVLAPHGDLRTGRRLTQLIEAAHEYDHLATVRPADFVDWIRSSTVSDAGTSRVRVMTIHQSKGLEFDIVVLPELHRPVSSNYPTVVVKRKGGDATAPIEEIWPWLARDLRSVLPGACEAAGEHFLAELDGELNLLYVAMTRARRALHIYIPAARPRKDGRSERRRQSLATIVLETLEWSGEGHDVVFEQGIREWDFETEETTVEQAAVRFPAPLRLRRAEPRRQWSQLAPSETEATVTRQPTGAMEVDTASLGRGAILHAWFQSVEWIEEPVPPDEELLSLARSLLPRIRIEDLNMLLDDFHRYLGQPGVRSVLSRPPCSVILERERPFAVRVDNRLEHGRVDRMETRMQGDGSLEIIITDFKTDRVPAESVPARASLYTSQMKAYARAIAVSMGIPQASVRGQLLFVEPDCIVEV